MLSTFSWQILAFLRNEDGPTAAEYAGMLALIVLVLIVAINMVGQTTSSYWSKDAREIEAGLNGS